MEMKAIFDQQIVHFVISKNLIIQIVYLMKSILNYLLNGIMRNFIMDMNNIY